MALIKHSKIKETGEILIKTKPVQVHVEPDALSPIEPENSGGERLDLSEAEQKASELIAEARSESKSIRDQAFEEGIEQGKNQAAENIKQSLQTLNEAVIERKKIIKDAESEILRLAIKASEQIIRSEVSLHRDVCLNIVSDAINRVSDREQVIIRVNREDADYIKKYKDKLMGIVDGVKSFSILEDSQIEPGGCVIETNLGYVDARISTKLQAIEDAFKKENKEEGE
ncbi:hypothetical protein HZC34_02255 [Candidatus Saganbacteria bacterium]|nr:hypothetical protein [Candidatus Saganbacteria bacterium]